MANVANQESERKNHWFRFYNESLDDPKVQRLPAHLFRTWVNILCLASLGKGTLPSIDDIAFRLRMSSQDAEQHLSDLIIAGLIDITPEGRTPHNWNGRQFVSDCSTERVRKHRKLKTETSCNVSEAASETPPEQSRAEQSRADTEQAAPAKARDLVDRPPAEHVGGTTDQLPKGSKRGSRLPASWSLPDDWRSWAQINFSPDDAAITLEAERFRDYWIAKPGAAGCKLDWQATWRNWCRNSKVPATLVRRPAAARPTEADEFRRLRAIAGPVEAWA